MKQWIRGLFAGLVLFFGARAFAAEEEAKPARAAVLEMRGRVRGLMPDVIFLAPELTEEAKGYRKGIAAVSDQGTMLENAFLSAEDFCSRGPLNVLRAAGYQVVIAQGNTWREACAMIETLFSVRRLMWEENPRARVPLCVVLSESVEPDALAETLPRLIRLESLCFLAPQEKTLPLTIFWKNYVWPAHSSAQAISVDHWVPTLAEVAGLPTPADVAAASVLPLLSGVGYQRPLQESEGTGGQAMLEADRACTMMCTFPELPQRCPWVPDFTDAKLYPGPSSRVFFAQDLPLLPSAAQNLSVLDHAQGLYFRTSQRKIRLDLPADISCVIRVQGRVVLSRWEPFDAYPWELELPEPQPLEFFLLIPAGFDPGRLPFFAEESAPVL